MKNHIEQIPLTLEEFKSLKKGNKLIVNTEEGGDYGEEIIVDTIGINLVHTSTDYQIYYRKLTLPSKWKFQKGDKVVRIIDNEKDCKVGNVYEIIKVSYQLSLKNCEGTYCNDCFRLAVANKHLIKSEEEKEYKNKQPEDAIFIVELKGLKEAFKFVVNGVSFKDNEFSTKKLYLENAISKVVDTIQKIEHSSGFDTTPDEKLKFTYGAGLTWDGESFKGFKDIAILKGEIIEQLDAYHCEIIPNPFYKDDENISIVDTPNGRFQIGDYVRVKESSKGMEDGWWYKSKHYDTIGGIVGYEGEITKIKVGKGGKLYVSLDTFNRDNYVLIDALELVKRDILPNPKNTTQTDEPLPLYNKTLGLLYNTNKYNNPISVKVDTLPTLYKKKY